MHRTYLMLYINILFFVPMIFLIWEMRPYVTLPRVNVTNREKATLSNWGRGEIGKGQYLL